MSRVERIREVLAGPLSPSYVEKKTGEGWKPVVVVWEREVEGVAPEPANIAEPVPYGLRFPKTACGSSRTSSKRKPWWSCWK